MSSPFDFIDPDQILREFFAEPKEIDPPSLPLTVEATGLNFKFLLSLVLKTMHVLGIETGPEIAGHLKINPGLVEKLLSTAKQQGHLEILGSVAANIPVLRYGLTASGRELASDALRQCQYVGPAPVTLADYRTQIARQSIAEEWVGSDDICRALSHLVTPKSLIRRLGPAINSGRALLLYGPPGNGKTSITEAIGQVFAQHIYVPYCLEVDGQVIKIFDPTLHIPASDGDPKQSEGLSLIKRKPDPRWVKCKRPVVTVGGELTLKMLDLEFDPISKFYEAPLQVKALGGVFIIDDFGRQLVQPKDLLNRWIIPLEKRIDYMTVHTGKKFEIPFDQLVIFSTNISPLDLMDAALLRRVKYKIRIDPPEFSDYAKIFQRVCEQYGLQLPEEILSFLLNDFYIKNGIPCAAFHPIFIVEHAIMACRFQGIRPRLTLELVKDALASIYVRDEDSIEAKPSPQYSQSNKISPKEDGQTAFAPAAEAPDISRFI
jgi:hypothetical protein